MVRIKELRKKARLSQKELAKKLNITSGAISFWENGITQPSWENIISMAELFNVSADYILGKDNPKNLSQEQQKALEKASYALILEDNPTIRRDGEIGKIVYNTNFQSLIISLLDLLLKSSQKDTIIAFLLQVVSEIKVKDFPIDKIEAYLDIMQWVLKGGETTDENAHEVVLKFVEGYLKKKYNGD